MKSELLQEHSGSRYLIIKCLKDWCSVAQVCFYGTYGILNVHQLVETFFYEPNMLILPSNHPTSLTTLLISPHINLLRKKAALILFLLTMNDWLNIPSNLQRNQNQNRPWFISEDQRVFTSSQNS